MTTTSARPSTHRTEPLALAGFVLGLASLVAWLLPLLGLPVGVVGLLLSALGRRRVRAARARNGAQATVGLVLSALGILLSLGNAALAAHLATR